MITPWRLLVHGALDGGLNMAIDRAIQVCREEGSAPPTLRLYQWSRPTVTLGKFQPSEDVDLIACNEMGVDVVRRFTGGRGVLHDQELTYAVIASVEDGIPRGTHASYEMLSAGLVHTYKVLGVEAALTTRERGHGGSSACYLHASRADLSHGAAKLAGSAQVWLGETVLQHGSLTLSRDVERDMRAFRLEERQRADYVSATLTINDLVTQPVEFGDIVSACIDGFRRALGIRLIRGELSIQEASIVTELRRTVLVNAS